MWAGWLKQQLYNIGHHRMMWEATVRDCKAHQMCTCHVMRCWVTAEEIYRFLVVTGMKLHACRSAHAHLAGKPRTILCQYPSLLTVFADADTNYSKTVSSSAYYILGS